MCFAIVEQLPYRDTMTGVKDQNVDNNTDTINIRMSLHQSLEEAAKNNRLISGLLQSAQMLDKNAEDVMFCVLPANSCDDVTLHLHVTLVEAFCRENDIPIIKVDDMSILSHGKENCILVQFPEECSASDLRVMEYYQEMV